MLTYQQRSNLCTNRVAKHLLITMETKKSNLCISADVTTKKELLKLADTLGPYICVFKTHADIVDDFDEDTAYELKRLASIHNFVIFEDRKFADIGNTVSLQYGGGCHRIADWATITNAHTVAGPGTIEGLKKVGLKNGNALLLLAQMSSKDNLLGSEYTEKTLKMAEIHKDFVIGFITQEKLLQDPTFINFTPGVQFSESSDSLGQQYNTPQYVIEEKGTDVIIVGRGICHADDKIAEAKKYQMAGWTSYLNRLQTRNHYTDPY